MAEGIREAIIIEDKKIKCPICGKTGGILNEGAVIKNYIVRCRASRSGREHFYTLNWNGEKGETKND